MKIKISEINKQVDQYAINGKDKKLLKINLARVVSSIEKEAEDLEKKTKGDFERSKEKLKEEYKKTKNRLEDDYIKNKQKLEAEILKLKSKHNENLALAKEKYNNGLSGLNDKINGSIEEIKTKAVDIYATKLSSFLGIGLIDTNTSDNQNV